MFTRRPGDVPRGCQGPRHRGKEETTYLEFQSSLGVLLAIFEVKCEPDTES